MKRRYSAHDDETKNISSLCKVASRLGVLLLIATLGTGEVWAQASVCVSQPWLGTNGPEVCVQITDDGTGSTYTERFPNAAQPGPFFWVNEFVGTWHAIFTFTYDIGPGGMAVTITGDARRQAPGSGWLNVIADGGTNTAIPAGTGSLWLDGTTTAASGVVLGGAAAYRTQLGGDVQFVGFPQVVQETTFGPGAFQGEIDQIPINHPESVAVHNHTGFHVNDVDDMIHIPSGVGAGDLPPTRDFVGRWSGLTVDTDHLPGENRVCPLTYGPSPELVVANVWYEGATSNLNAFRIQPPYGEDNITNDGVIDSGSNLYGIHKICLVAPNHAVAPYIKVEGQNRSVWVAEFANGGWGTSLVSATAADDFFSVTCFKTADGVFLNALNATEGTFEVLKRTPVGEYDPWMTLGPDELGGAPGLPGFSAFSKAGDLGPYGLEMIGDAIFTAGLVDGTLAVGQLRTDVKQLVGLWNAGPADGDTSADISTDEVLGRKRASVNWTVGDEVWHATWFLDEGLVEPRKVLVGTMETGVLVPFQDVSGAGSDDGYYHLVAGRCYVLDPERKVLEELWSYPCRNVGGPVDMTRVNDPDIEGFAACPGSQRLGILSAPPTVSDFSVPAMARVRGAGAFFTSVMQLFNNGHSDLELEMTFTPRGGSGGEVTTVTHTVPAGGLQTIEDPLEALFGFGGSAGRVGSVLITVTEGSAADLMVQTVVFAQLDSGEEYGQFFPAMRVVDRIGAGQTAYLNTTENPVSNRVNIGLMAVVDGTRFRVTPVDPLGSGLVAPRTYDLDMGGNTQINNLHTTFGLGTMADIVVEVEVLTGSGFAYASVLDGNGAYSGTSDPTTILPTLGGSGQVTLLEIGSIQGLNEFSGSACITNYSDRPAAVQADFFQRGVPGVTATENLSIAAGDTLGFTDLGGDLFGISGDVGTVELTATNGTLIGATGREFAIFRDGPGDVIGTAGQLIAGQTDSDRLDPGTTYHFIGLRQADIGGAVERSHFAVYNPETTDAEVTVRLYDGASGTIEGQRSWTIGSKTLIQVNNVIQAINPSHDAGEKRIEVEVNRRVFMNAFRVNRWGDPVTLSPFPG